MTKADTVRSIAGATGGSTAGVAVLCVMVYIAFKYYSWNACSDKTSEDEDKVEQQQQAQDAESAGASAPEDVDVEMQAVPPPPVPEFAQALQPTEFAHSRENSAQNEPESAFVCPPGHTMMRHPSGQNIAVPDGHTVMQGVDGRIFFEPTQAVSPPQEEGVAEAQHLIKSASPHEKNDPAVNTSRIFAQPPAPTLDCPPGHTMMRHPNGQIIAVPDGHTVMQGADGEIFFGKTQY
jgi:hypothetical protein